MSTTTFKQPETPAQSQPVVRQFRGRTKWEQHPNENVRTLHVDFDLWDSIEADCFEIAMTDEQQQLVEDLGDIRGVTKFGFDKYEIRVTKGDVFDWDEIAPRVEAIFKEWCGN